MSGQHNTTQRKYTKRHSRGRPRTLNEEHMRRERIVSKVLKLDPHKDNGDIAKETQLPPSTIEPIKSRLRKKGKIVPLPRGTPLSDDEKKRREKEVIRMSRKVATNTEIGRVFNVSGERARQLKVLIIKKYGKNILEPRKQLWTTEEVATKFEIPADVIRRICSRGEVSCHRRSNSERSTWLIDEKGMKKLPQHPSVTGERVCDFCEKAFINKAKAGSKKFCSVKCSQKRHKQQHDAYADHEPTVDSLKGWHVDLFRRLEKHRILKREKWITLGGAVACSGLSTMQITHLKHRNLVTIKGHPTRTWGGCPMTLYATSEMKIAGKIFRSFKQKTTIAA